jgi:hypothetical protein
VRTAPGRWGDQARLDDNPVERMRAITERLGGVPHEPKGKPPYGRNLKCPMPNCTEKHTLKIDIGRLPNRLIVRCKNHAHNQNALVRAVTKATGVSLFPRPRPASPSEIMGQMRRAVEQMRQTTQYKGLPPRSKALVEHLIESVIVNGEPNGGISHTGTELMAALGISSWRWLYEAINAAIEAGIVIKGSRGLSHGYRSGPSNLWGLVCRPIDPEGRSKKRAEAAPKPRWASSRKRPKPKRTRGQCAGRTWRENVQKAGERAAQPFDNASCDSGSYAGAGDYPPRAAQAEPEQGSAGEANCWSPDDHHSAERGGMNDCRNPNAWPP